jgi:hypothetical protein
MDEFVSIFLYYFHLFIYVALPGVSTGAVGFSPGLCPHPAGPGGGPIPPPISEPILEHMLLLTDAVSLSPEAMNVNTQQHRYVRYKSLSIMNMRVKYRVR